MFAPISKRVCAVSWCAKRSGRCTQLDVVDQPGAKCPKLVGVLALPAVLGLSQQAQPLLSGLNGQSTLA